MKHVNALLDRARQDTGLEDFGDPGFHEGLERLVHALDTEARLSASGQVAIDALLVNRLSNRLRIEDWYRRHPEIDDQTIVAPLIGLGLPRTGSTALFHLLSKDPAVRTVRMWEGLSPTPPPVLDNEAEDPRVVAANAAIAARNRDMPRKQTMLPAAVDSPLECGTFMGYDFKSQFFQSLAWIPSYTQWLLHEADLRPTYRYLKRILKLLQWKRPPTRWRLKNPSHSPYIEALDAVFPDARYWMTHRDVTRVIPSVADLYYEQHRAYRDDVDTRALGRFNVEVWEIGMRRMMAFRDAGNESRFFDIRFEPFQRDPFPILHQLYAFLGETLTPEAEAAMRAWRAATPRGQHGAHVLADVDFGVDDANLRDRFAFYSARYLGDAEAAA